MTAITSPTTITTPTRMSSRVFFILSAGSGLKVWRQKQRSNGIEYEYRNRRYDNCSSGASSNALGTRVCVVAFIRAEKRYGGAEYRRLDQGIDNLERCKRELQPSHEIGWKDVG